MKKYFWEGLDLPEEDKGGKDEERFFGELFEKMKDGEKVGWSYRGSYLGLNYSTIEIKKMENKLWFNYNVEDEGCFEWTADSIESAIEHATGDQYPYYWTLEAVIAIEKGEKLHGWNEGYSWWEFPQDQERGL